MKNNITRLLDQRKIEYTIFELPAEKLGAEMTAELLGLPLDIVFKTIVVKRAGRGKPILAVVPGSDEVDLKKLAKVVGEKKIYLTTQKEAEELTGLDGSPHLAGPGVASLALDRGALAAVHARLVAAPDQAVGHEQVGRMGDPGARHLGPGPQLVSVLGSQRR